MDDVIKERVKYKTERLKLSALTGLASAGGTVSLLLREPTPLRQILLGLGTVVTLIFVVAVWRQDRDICRLLDQEDSGGST